MTGNWWPRLRGDRLRTRLMGAFLALFVGALALAGVGLWGMQRTQSELRAYETEVLPQIGRSLEIAERISRLAATAPNLAESRNAETLKSNADVARSLLDEIRQRSSMADARGRLAARVGPLIERGQGDFNQLTELTEARQRLRDELLQRMEALEQIGISLRAAHEDEQTALLAQLWSSLVLATQTSSATTLGRIEADAESLLSAAHEHGAFSGASQPLAQRLQALTGGKDGVLALRRQLLELDNRSDALVALTRSNADLLSDIVSADVAQLRDVTQTRSALVHAALASGKTGLLLLATICLLVSAASAWYVHRLVQQVERITGVMSRLAAGDTTQETPATRRRDEVGALARTFEVFRDNLIAKQQLVAELRGQGELLAAVHNSMNDGLAVFDGSRGLRLWNPALQQMLRQHGLKLEAGEPPERLLPQLPPEAAWRLPGQAEWHAFDAALVPPFAPSTHVELRLPGQRVYDLRSHAMPDGGAVATLTDLTERRAIETQLQHAMRLDMLGRLTGGVAHDFHNHLGTIVGNLGLLQQQAQLDEADAARLARAQRAAERATALTRRLLAFARRQPLQAEWVDVDSMIEEMADLIEYSAGASVQVELTLACDGAGVYLDRSQLENALLNLVINSSAAMPGGGRLAVATRRERGPQARDEVVIEVVDTGCGIPDALQDKVFEPFFTTKQGEAGQGQGEGSGLGLSIVHGFVHQSGGRVSLHSRVGEGTRVTLRFPVADMRMQASAPALVAPTGAAAAQPAAAECALQVLLVDDDDAFRATVTDMLHGLGHRVHAVATPAEALVALAQQPAPDLLLSDVRLAAGEDGRALARQAAALRPELPIGLMSGVPREALLQTGGALPWPFALKPFDREGLVRWLDEVMAQAAHPV